MRQFAIFEVVFAWVVLVYIGVKHKERISIPKRSQFPIADKSMVDADLENDMQFVLDAVQLGRAARNKANIKNACRI